jgi:aminoglycoside 3-N-acetyltransferase I
MIRTRRLAAGERDVARRLFTMMADAFEEPNEPLGDGYLARLLGREDFWAIAAFDGDDVVGGLTAHTLPMTRVEGAEVFLYDIAVRADWRRRGVGRQLVAALREGSGCEVFVPADGDDDDACDFYRALGGVAAAVTIFTFRPPAR